MASLQSKKSATNSDSKTAEPKKEKPVKSKKTSDKAAEAESKTKKTEKEEDSKPVRGGSCYILFCGNLSYSTTKEEVEEFFKKGGCGNVT